MLRLPERTEMASVVVVQMTDKITISDSNARRNGRDCIIFNILVSNEL